MSKNYSFDWAPGAMALKVENLHISCMGAVAGCFGRVDGE